MIHGDVTVDCELKTFNIDDHNDISLADECNQNKIVIDANLFTEFLHRLDNISDELKITLSPEPPYFSLTSLGIAVRYTYKLLYFELFIRTIAG